jgi:acetyltransferase-like isoleucine patch superfamily enzyme
MYTVIEDDVFIAPGVMTTNDLYPVNYEGLKVSIVRRGALIGSGSVVTRDIPPRAIAYGSPARPHRALS